MARAKGERFEDATQQGLGRKDEALRYAEKAIAALDSDTAAPDASKARIRQSAEDKIRQLTKKD